MKYIIKTEEGTFYYDYFEHAFKMLFIFNDYGKNKKYEIEKIFEWE